MSQKRGSSIVYDQSTPIPNDDMILSFCFTSDTPSPGESAYPSGTISLNATSPGSFADGNVFQFPRAGVLSSLRIKGDTVAVTTAEVFTVEKNGVASTLVATAAVGQTVGTDNTHSVSIVAGDYISINRGANATPTFSSILGSMYFTPA